MLVQNARSVPKYQSQVYSRVTFVSCKQITSASRESKISFIDLPRPAARIPFIFQVKIFISTKLFRAETPARALYNPSPLEECCLARVLIVSSKQQQKKGIRVYLHEVVLHLALPGEESCALKISLFNKPYLRLIKHFSLALFN